MGISFRKIEAKARLINPLKGFIADEIPLESRKGIQGTFCR